MAEFKKGDRVVFTKDTVGRGARGGLVALMPEGTLGTYDDAPGEGAPWVRLDTGRRVRAWASRIAPAEDHGTGDGSASDICAEPGCNCDLERRFPAPLDPSKVKPGDTVTLSLEGAHVTDVVASWERNPASDHYRAYLTHDPDPFDAKPFRLVGSAAYTLTAHQPAPEPEPEYMVGHVYEAKVANVGRVQVVRVDPDMDEDPLYPFPWFAPSMNDHYTERAVTDVRPLVVLDPESDTDRLWNIIREVDGNHDLGAGALAEAILERLSR